MQEQTCKNKKCNYKWKSRIPNPKACPRCKVRLDIDYEKKTMMSPTERTNRAWITKKLTGFTGIKKGEESPNFKKGKISYSGVHGWLIKNFGKATYCSNDNTHKSKRFEWANISGEYKRDIRDYKPLCVSCHDIFDNVIEKRPKDMFIRGWATRRAKNV